MKDGTVQARGLHDLGQNVDEGFNRMKDHPDIVKKPELAAQKLYAKMSQNVRPTGTLVDK